MIEVVRTTDAGTGKVDETVAAVAAGDGAWVKLSSPTANEINLVCGELSIEQDDLVSALNLDEKVRMKIADDYTLVLLDIPVHEVRRGEDTFDTVPLGVVLCRNVVVTVCSENTPFLSMFSDDEVRGFTTWDGRRFVYQLLLRGAAYYQQVLEQIDLRRVEFEQHIKKAMNETDLVSLHELESTLVYLTTSLRGNDNVLTRLRRHCRDSCTEEDIDLLEDAIVETQRSIEMAQIYRDIIDGTRELLSSVMDLRLNNVMQRLTSITIIMSIPTIVAGIYGMNFNPEDVPLALADEGFALICVMTAAICMALAVYLRRRRLL